MKKIIILLFLTFSSLAKAEEAATGCVCNPNMTETTPLARYGSIYKNNDVIFVGRIIDSIQINPIDYIIVFEETELIKGKPSKIKYSTKNKKTDINIRYLLASESESECLFQFKNFYEKYIVVAAYKSKEHNLLVAPKCNGSTQYNKMAFDLLIAAKKSTEK